MDLLAEVSRCEGLGAGVLADADLELAGPIAWIMAVSAASFDARCKKAGVRQIKIHDTRRTCGSLLAALDVHPRVAIAILRHSRVEMTMEIYTQVPDRTTREALERLIDLFGSTRPTSPTRRPTGWTAPTGPATTKTSRPNPAAVLRCRD
jgi:hypothetical protein